MKRYVQNGARTILTVGALAGYLVVKLPLLVKWFLLRLINLFSFFVVLCLYVLSLPVPLIGRLLIENESKTKLPEFHIGERIETFREDMMEIMVAKHRPNHQNTRKNLKASIELTYLTTKKKYETGELVVSFWGGIATLLISIFQLWEYFAKLLSIYLLLITVSILVRIIVLDLLAYSQADAKATMRKDRLELMDGWNKAVLENIPTQLLILFLALLNLVHGPSYKIAKGLMEKYHYQSLNRREALEYLIDEAF